MINGATHSPFTLRHSQFTINNPSLPLGLGFAPGQRQHLPEFVVYALPAAFVVPFDEFLRDFVAVEAFRAIPSD